MPEWEPWPLAHAGRILFHGPPRLQVALNSKTQVLRGEKEGHWGEAPSSTALVHRPQPRSFTSEQLLASPFWPGLWLIPSTISTGEVRAPRPDTPLLVIHTSAPCSLDFLYLLSAFCPQISAIALSLEPVPPPTGPKILLLVLFFGVSLAIYLAPLCISSPCLMEPRHLPPKPGLVGHRGAPMVSVGQNAGEARRGFSSRTRGLPGSHPSLRPCHQLPSLAGP